MKCAHCNRVDLTVSLRLTFGDGRPGIDVCRRCWREEFDCPWVEAVEVAPKGKR
jgi:hypothetical protein